MFPEDYYHNFCTGNLKAYTFVGITGQPLTFTLLTSKRSRNQATLPFAIRCKKKSDYAAIGYARSLVYGKFNVDAYPTDFEKWKLAMVYDAYFLSDLHYLIMKSEASHEVKVHSALCCRSHAEYIKNMRERATQLLNQYPTKVVSMWALLLSVHLHCYNTCLLNNKLECLNLLLLQGLVQIVAIANSQMFGSITCLTHSLGMLQYGCLSCGQACSIQGFCSNFVCDAGPPNSAVLRSLPQKKKSKTKNKKNINANAIVNSVISNMNNNNMNSDNINNNGNYEHMNYTSSRDPTLLNSTQKKSLIDPVNREHLIPHRVHRYA